MLPHYKVKDESIVRLSGVDLFIERKRTTLSVFLRFHQSIVRIEGQVILVTIQRIIFVRKEILTLERSGPSYLSTLVLSL